MKQWIKDNIFGAVIVAIIIGAGGFVIDNRTELNVHNEKIENVKNQCNDNYDNMMSAAKSNDEALDELKEKAVTKDDLKELEKELKIDINDLKNLVLQIIMFNKSLKSSVDNINKDSLLYKDYKYGQNIN